MARAIAVIGMACRFPGAGNINSFWRNVVDAKCSIQRFSADQLRQLGVASSVLEKSNYIPCSGFLEGVEKFDEALFGFSPSEAMVLDPQQRIALEIVWTALENAGYAPRDMISDVGVFASCSSNKYFLYEIFGKRHLALGDHDWAIDDLPTGSAVDSFAPRISYKFGFMGPSITVQTACSSSLVATTLAAEALSTFSCDLAVVCGSSVILPQHSGYLYRRGGTLSSDGFCRPFDERASGSVFGSGVGAVVLKRLEDAVREQDRVFAVIDGWATRNDGAYRAGFAAPGLEGQAALITEAQEFAGISPSDVGLLEAHGSATQVGDPIEFRALTKSFSRRGFVARQACALGSIKSNIGHLDAAAGIAGFIKGCLAVFHGVIPAMHGFSRPNKEIALEESPFFIPLQALPWDKSPSDRIVGVSSFGMGGTGAHVILRGMEDSQMMLSTRSRSWKVAAIPVSANNKESLREGCSAVEECIATRKEELDNIAYTMTVARSSLAYRSVCLLERGQNPVWIRARDERHDYSLVFAFPGIAIYDLSLVHDFYNEFLIFREHFDAVSSLVKKYLSLDLVAELKNSRRQPQRVDPFATLKRSADDIDGVRDVSCSHTVSFCFSYAMARLLCNLNIYPEVLIGYSIGEFASLAVAEAFELDTIVRILCDRVKGLHMVEAGAMLSVPESHERVARLLVGDAEVSGMVSRALTVVSGSIPSIRDSEKKLLDAGIRSKRLPSNYAFHHSMMGRLSSALMSLDFPLVPKEPKTDLISTVTGEWADLRLLNSKDYFGRHVSCPVLFEQGLQRLLEAEQHFNLLEVGFGSGLSQAIDAAGPSLHQGRIVCEAAGTTVAEFYRIVAKLWCEGYPVELGRLHQGRGTRRDDAPTYHFRQNRFWVGRPELQVETPLTPRTSDFSKSCSGPTPRPDLMTVYQEPRSDAERDLANMWRELLGYELIGVDDDFIELGGNSLLMIRLSSMILERKGVDLAPSTIFENPTIRKQALLCGRR